MDVVTFLFGIGLGLLVAAILRAVWGLSGTAPRPEPREPETPFGWETARAPPSPASPNLPADRPREIVDLVEGPASSTRPRIEIRDPEAIEPIPATPERAPARTPPGVDPAALRLSQRIVLHLYRLGSFDPRELSPRGATQLGMTEELSVRQSSLTKVLIRLVAAGVLEEARSHVRGMPRRLKVYWLTPLGTSLARDLRSSAAPGSPPAKPHAELPEPR